MTRKELSIKFSRSGVSLAINSFKEIAFIIRAIAILPSPGITK